MVNLYENVAMFLRARFGHTERGASLVEYVLLVALIAVAAIVAMQLIGNKSSSQLSKVGSTIASAGS